MGVGGWGGGGGGGGEGGKGSTEHLDPECIFLTSSLLNPAAHTDNRTSTLVITVICSFL